MKVPKAGDVIEVIRSFSGTKEKLKVVEFGTSAFGKYWLVAEQILTSPSGIVNQEISIALDCIESFRIIDSPVENIAAETKQNLQVALSLKKKKVIPPDFSPEVSGIAHEDRLKSLAELRSEQQKLKMDQIKDHLSRTDLKDPEHVYQFPSFKKRS